MREEVLRSEKEEMEAVLAQILRWGILLSLLLLLLGLVLHLLQGGQGLDLSQLDSFSLLAHLTSHPIWNGVTVMVFGLALLILTPIFRVVATFLIFVKEKDRLYIRFTSLVMVIIVISIILGFIVEPK